MLVQLVLLANMSTGATLPSVTIGQTQQVKEAPRITQTRAKDPEILLKLVNDFRRKNKLPEVTLCKELSQAALWFAKDLASKEKLTHEDSAGRFPDKRVESFGYKDWRVVCENVAGGADDVQEAFEMWLKSPGHLKNLKNPEVRDMGFGYHFDPKSKYLKYWVQDFGALKKPISLY